MCRQKCVKYLIADFSLSNKLDGKRPELISFMRATILFYFIEFPALLNRIK